MHVYKISTPPVQSPIPSRFPVASPLPESSYAASMDVSAVRHNQEMLGTSWDKWKTTGTSVCDSSSSPHHPYLSPTLAEYVVKSLFFMQMYGYVLFKGTYMYTEWRITQ